MQAIKAFRRLPAVERALWVGAAVALAAFLLSAAVGCNTPTAPDVSVNVTQIVGGQPSPAPSPTALPGCPTVALVTVGLSGQTTTTFRAGTQQVLDVTPRASDRSEVPSQCHGATVDWALGGGATCQLTGNVSGFNPTVACSTPGTLTATATVAPPGGTGSAIFTVTP